MKNVRVFGCTAYVLQLCRGCESESRALEGVYLETIDDEVFKVAVKSADGFSSIIDSGHVTLDDSKFLGASNLDTTMDPEDHSYSGYEKSDSNSEADLVISDNISIEDSQIDETESDADSELEDSSIHSNLVEAHEERAETSAQAVQRTSTPRHPRS